MNDSLSPSALERHKSQGGPCRASRLSLASNSSPGRLLGTGNRQELNPSGRWGWHGPWRSVQVGASISLERTPNCVIQHLDKGFFLSTNSFFCDSCVFSQASLGRKPEDEGRRPSDPAMPGPAFSARHGSPGFGAHRYSGQGDWGYRGGWDASKVLLLPGPAAISHQWLPIYNSPVRGKMLWLSGKDWGRISNVCLERGRGGQCSRVSRL